MAQESCIQGGWSNDIDTTRHGYRSRRGVALLRTHCAEAQWVARAVPRVIHAETFNKESQISQLVVLIYHSEISSGHSIPGTKLVVEKLPKGKNMDFVFRGENAH